MSFWRLYAQAHLLFYSDILFIYTEYPEKSRRELGERGKCYKSPSATGAGNHQPGVWAQSRLRKRFPDENTHLFYIFLGLKLLFPSSVFNVADCPFWTSLCTLSFWVSYNKGERPESADRDLNGPVWRHIKNSHFRAVIWSESWCLCMFVWNIKNMQCIKYKNSYQPLCVSSYWGNQARLQVLHQIYWLECDFG